MPTQLIGILGGTFNPIHNGHLSIAKQAYADCGLDRVLMIPNRIPPHRDEPPISAKDRMAMLKLAIKDTPYLQADDCEQKREGPSFMVDTLVTLKTQNPDTHLCLIIGDDSLANFPKWHRYTDILTLAHLVIFPRAIKNSTIKFPKELIAYTKSSKKCSLIDQESAILFTVSANPIDISSTTIRAELARRPHGEHGNLPKAVLAYIEEQQLYVR